MPSFDISYSSQSSSQTEIKVIVSNDNENDHFYDNTVAKC